MACVCYLGAMRIREATRSDRDAINSIYSSAFPQGEVESVAEVAINLLSESTVPRTISLVAETEGALVGHVGFSPVSLGTDGTRQGYILAPLAVRPGNQNRGIGTELVKEGMRQLTAMGIDMLFVYGDPRYYARFGFSDIEARPYTPPYELEYPFGWQGIALGARGEEGAPVKIGCVSSLCHPTLW